MGRRKPLEKCCCGCSLRLGVLIVAAILLISIIIQIVTIAVDSKRLPDALHVAALTQFVVLLIFLSVPILLVCGVFAYKPKCILAAIILLGVQLALIVAAIIVRAVLLGDDHQIFTSVLLVVFILSMRSYLLFILLFQQYILLSIGRRFPRVSFPGDLLLLCGAERD